MFVGLLHLGDPAGGIHRYGRALADALAALPDVRDRMACAVAAGALAGRIRRRRVRRRGPTVVVPPADPGDGCDAALVRATVAALRRRRGGSIVVGELADGGGCAPPAEADGSLPLGAWFASGRRRHLLRAGLALGWRLGATEAVFVLGADTSDADRARRRALADLAAGAGAPPVDAGESAVFLLEPERSGAVRADLEWAARERSQGRAVLGLNLNPLTMPRDADGAVAACAAAVADVAARGTSVLFLPHDDVGEPSDLSLVHDLVAQLPAAAAAHCLVPGAPRAPAEIKALVADLDGVLTGRVHGAITALGQRVPTRCVDHSGRAARVFELAGIDGRVAPDAMLGRGAIAGMLRQLVVRGDAERARLTARIPHVLERAERTFNRPAA